jgi:multidrug efflux system outer membrane protein
MSTVARSCIAASVALGVLCGCAVGPDYTRPAVVAPPSFRSQVGSAEATSLADAPWWEAFRDPVLQQLVQEALASNYNVRVAAARVQEARAQVGVARSRFFPQIGYTGRIQYDRNGIAAQLGLSPGSPQATDLYFGALYASWELDIWGRIRRLDESAVAQLMGTEDARRGVLLALVGDIAQNYFELLALDTQLDIARASVKAFQGTYDLFMDRYVWGVVSQLQTSRAQGALGSAQATVPEIEAEIAAKENQISTLLGRPPGPIKRGAPMFAQSIAPTVPAGLPSDLLARRPDLRQAEQQMVHANALIGVAKAEFFPKLSLTGLLGTASPEISALTSGTALVYNVAAGLTGPLFQGGRILENYRAHQAVWEQAKNQYLQAVLAAFQEVSSALSTLAKLAEAETGQDRAVKGLEAAVSHATDRYLYGLSSYFEVLDAQQRLYPAQHTLAEIRRNRLLAYVQLYKALGGGWNLTDPQWSGPAPAPEKTPEKSAETTQRDG